MKNKRKKLEVSFSPEDYELIRKKFDRKAAEMARLFLLGYRVSMPSQNQKQLGLILRAMALHRHQVLAIRKLVEDTHGKKVAALLDREQHLFNSILQLWISSYSDQKKAA